MTEDNTYIIKLGTDDPMDVARIRVMRGTLEIIVGTRECYILPLAVNHVVLIPTLKGKEVKPDAEKPKTGGSAPSIKEGVREGKGAA